ncbi:MAG: acyl carrier protein [Alphaproteobacteria bacterium]|nr:acyl carrier protein [Alphaproteobacteria bacterium]
MLRDRLIGLVTEILAKNAIERIPAIDARLSEVGLSSMDMVNLMFAVEAAFDVELPAAEITPENFYSIASIEALLTRLGVSAAS